jgi:hypothetical protein
MYTVHFRGDVDVESGILYKEGHMVVTREGQMIDMRMGPCVKRKGGWI